MVSKLPIIWKQTVVIYSCSTRFPRQTVIHPCFENNRRLQLGFYFSTSIGPAFLFGRACSNYRQARPIIDLITRTWCPAFPHHPRRTVQVRKLGCHRRHGWGDTSRPRFRELAVAMGPEVVLHQPALQEPGAAPLSCRHAIRTPVRERSSSSSSARARAGEREGGGGGGQQQQQQRQQQQQQQQQQMETRGRSVICESSLRARSNDRDVP